ncbi:MAG TPA: NfeD family protein [Iamia sp.]|nr:NfeD family protein [Iamia sp.]
MRRLSTTTRRTGALALGLGLVVLALATLLAGPAGAQEGADEPAPCAERAEAGEGRLAVVTVSGLLDPVLARFVERSIDDAEDAQVSWLVLQVNSKGTVVSDARLAELVERVRTARVPVALWVDVGHRATEGLAQIAAVACEVGIAPGGRLGDLGDPVVAPDRFTPAFRDNLDRIEGGTVGAGTARELGLVEREPPVLGSFLIDLDGVETEVVEGPDGQQQRTVTGDSIPVFSKLPIVDQLLHTVSSPAVAYLLLLTGLALIVFELFTAGIGVAGVVGAGCTVLGCYGLAVLPARGWAVALLVLTVLAYAVDVQTGVPRVWTGIGTVALIVGSFSLYDGLTLSWITLLVGIVGMLIFVIGAMPAMVRTRFSTPTIGRGWMIGEEGEAVTEVSPEGVVRVRGAPWRARTNRATPLAAGDAVRVIEVDGLLLEVEPLEGGARDHRERRSDG